MAKITQHLVTSELGQHHASEFPNGSLLVDNYGRLALRTFNHVVYVAFAGSKAPLVRDLSGVEVTGPFRLAPVGTQMIFTQE